MSELAQDYTYRVLSVDSSGSSIIRITSYDSLDLDWDLQLRAGDSDGSIAAFVDTVIDHTIHHWAAQREAVPVVTINAPVADRWKPRTTSAFPSYNFLTQYVDSYDSETNDLITTLYSVRSLTDSEKAETYANLSVSRADMFQNLLDNGYLNSIESDLGIEDISNDSDEVAFRNRGAFEFYEPIMQRVQASLSLNDSDFAKLFVVE